MKFFLAVLLLVAVTSATVEEKYFDLDDLTDVELESFLGNVFKGVGNFFGKIGRGIGNAVRTVGGWVRTGVNWLKTNNLWDPLVNFVRDKGQGIATGICSRFIGAGVCNNVVGWAWKKIF